MRTAIIFACAITAVTGCSEGVDSIDDQAGSVAPVASSPPANDRRGSITVDGETWTISSFRQCSVYPGGIVSIWGSAARNPELEIVIDYGGPDQVRIGNDGPDAVWQTDRDTLELQIDGRSVSGTATFSRYAGGTKETAQGTIDVNC